MLSSLHIRNFAIIEKLDVDFSKGLNIVTGETGAGKSIILGALQLLLGHRATKNMIRIGAESCDVSGLFDLNTDSKLLKTVDGILTESGIPCCENAQLIVARKLTTKSGKNYINSSPATLKLLVTLGDLLVDLHGPYDHQSLIQPRAQLDLLDAFGNLGAHREKFRDKFAELSKTRQDIETFKSNVMTPEQIDILRFQLSEIQQIAPKHGEDEELTLRHASAANRHEILGILNKSLQHLNSDSGVLSQINAIMRDLNRLQHFDPKEGSRHTIALENIYETINEFCSQLNIYAEKIDIDPAAFAEIEERLSVIQKLKQKYGGSVKAIIEYGEKIEDNLFQLENRDQHLQNLQEQSNAIENELRDQASTLSQERQKHASKLQKLITDKLKHLGFKDGLFSINLSATTMNVTGMDLIEFQFAPNPGEGTKPLKDSASAGEISRVMLATKTVLAKADQVPVLVFDEIDVNIGGRVAAKVGEELANLGRERQVLCITHLPQVAANGNRHFSIEKSISRGRTKTTVTLLIGKDRVHEIARMLGGAESTSVALKHAEELLNRA